MRFAQDVQPPPPIWFLVPRGFRSNNWLHVYKRNILSKIRSYDLWILSSQEFQNGKALVSNSITFKFFLVNLFRCAVLDTVKMVLFVSFSNQFAQKWLQRFILNLIFMILRREIALSFKISYDFVWIVELYPCYNAIQILLLEYFSFTILDVLIIGSYNVLLLVKHHSFPLKLLVITSIRSSNFYHHSFHFFHNISFSGTTKNPLSRWKFIYPNLLIWSTFMSHWWWYCWFNIYI